MESSMTPAAKADTTPAPAKTPYTAPKLVIHGSVGQITQNISPGGDDGGIGSTINLDN
jgi:hypothetical protein